MKLTDIINEEGFQDKKDRLIKKTEAYYRLYRTGTFDHSIKHSLRNHDRMETHTFQYKLSEFHKVTVPFGSNIPTLICDAHITDITGGDMGGNYDPITIYVIRGYLKRIFDRKDIQISIKNATGDVEPRDEPRDSLFGENMDINEEEESSEDMMKDHDQKQLKKLESVFKFYKRGSMVIYPDGQKRHTVDYVLSDNAEFKKFINEDKNYYYIKVPEITLFVRSKELYDTLQYNRLLEKQGTFKSGSELEIIKNKIMIPFRKKNIQTDIFYSAVKIKRIKPQLNEEVSPEFEEYLNGVRKKAIKAYNHFRKGKVKWHDDIYEYELSEDFLTGGFGLLEGKKRYYIIYPSELIIKGHGLYKKQHSDYPNGYMYQQQHLPFEEIQKLFGKLFDKYKVGIRLKDHTTINRVKGDDSQLTEGNSDDVERLKKKAESYYKFFKRGKIEFGGIEYKYELSDDYNFTINKMMGVTHPILRPTGIMITNITPESDKKIPMAEIIRFFNKHVFHKYGVVVSFTNADFVGDVKEQINENEGEESEEKIREVQRKKCESVYKFLKKGTFQQTYVNVRDVDNYEYQLSDEFEILTHKKGNPTIRCGAHIKCLSRDRKMRPHIILIHLGKIFEKYHITLSPETLTGDIDRVSPAKPFGYDD
jgi:hypothetical protein